MRPTPHSAKTFFFGFNMPLYSPAWATRVANFGRTLSPLQKSIDPNPAKVELRGAALFCRVPLERYVVRPAWA
jgi:hypothetical protein